uniref:Protein phosphatase n=1 Tax=Albugo laibachii Nc14 TaxID=890382 RepID=F0W1I4_9STRA|nr:protein phosphatase putative [Albugo laibachii Nc14]|eukprot:CCA14913.1 protein phosphatase putative [Albugo laibachii Nc14]
MQTNQFVSDVIIKRLIGSSTFQAMHRTIRLTQLATRCVPKSLPYHNQQRTALFRKRFLHGSSKRDTSEASNYSFLSPRSWYRGFHHCNDSSENKGKDGCTLPEFIFKARVACQGKGKKASAKDRVGKKAADPNHCGEDSYFVADTFLGVADGVGGWNENGVDPGQVSRSMMRNASNFIQEQGQSPFQTLQYAFQQMLGDPNVEAGSTTACILQINSVRSKTGDKFVPVLAYANLGDSGFVVIRNGKILFRSEFQYYGRAPYQLAKVPPQFKEYGAIENQPRDAKLGDIELQVGDVIVLATDGVWDNFAPDLGASTQIDSKPGKAFQKFWKTELHSLIDIVQNDTENAAKGIVEAAIRHNLKPDDITVIVAQVVANTSRVETNRMNEK